MIDIHCHVLYGVDDGAKDQTTSREMIDRMAGEGVTAIIATPHFRHHMFDYPLQKIDEAYEDLREYAAGKGIELLLGCEYHVDGEIFENLENKRIHTIGNYVLSEFSYSADFVQLLTYTQDLIMRGWKPIIAHAERCEVFQRKPKLVEEILDAGALIQINANSILGLDGRAVKKTARKFLDMEVVDFIASDAHDLDERASHLGECYDFVKRKYGDETADMLFEGNARQLIQ